MSFEYREQPHPGGLAQAFLIGESFLNGSPSCLVLGDNIFYGHGFSENVQKGVQLSHGALIFGYYVNDPERYGVVEFDANKKVVNLVEKPKSPKSNYAIPGIYFYDGTASAKAKMLKPSPRGELEITDLNKLYLAEGTLKVDLLGRGMAWLDTGTHDSLLEASNFISVIEKRQGLKVGCPEEIAFRSGFITQSQLMGLAEKFANSGYGQYLKKIALES
jgi:glucose-1-phosphate thymidylyltransferase